MKKKMISRRDVISRSAAVAGAFVGAPYLGAFANTASASTLVNDPCLGLLRMRGWEPRMMAPAPTVTTEVVAFIVRSLISTKRTQSLVDQNSIHKH